MSLRKEKIPFRNDQELFIHRLLSRKFDRNTVHYEQIALGSPDSGYMRPDFDIVLRYQTLLIEVTNAQLEPYKDPKSKQRKIFMAETERIKDLSWMLLYFQNCVTVEAINMTLASLDALVSGTDSLVVQGALDAYAINHHSSLITNKVPWDDLYTSSFAYRPGRRKV